ncbi:MAG: Holliday junction branch migration protein RuvA [Treponema sp.]|nr:Holliday junction branch migration protein RuvA [Treponema sp.]
MFNSVTGKITGKFPQQLFLENNGIEFDFLMPDTSLEKIGSVGDTVKVFTWLYHKEDSMRLFGFSSVNDREFFLDLLKVNGVGPKVAVKILSNISCNELAKALDNEDIALIEKVQGIGKKTAQKMMLTLKGKLTLNDENYGIREKPKLKWQDVITALINMGYDKKNIESVIEKIEIDAKKEIAEFSNDTQKEEFIFRRAIVELAQ